jgi:hypothetical protein
LYTLNLSLSQLSRARVAFLLRIDDSVKKQAREEYSPTDANGVAFCARSTMLDELNEQTEDQHRDLMIASETIASPQHALGES